MERPYSSVVGVSDPSGVEGNLIDIYPRDRLFISGVIFERKRDTHPYNFYGFTRNWEDCPNMKGFRLVEIENDVRSLARTAGILARTLSTKGIIVNQPNPGKQNYAIFVREK